MIRSELIQKIADENPHLTQRHVERIVNTVFEEIIDVRTPAEFADDHIPGSINCPVLDDEERIRVGTLYKQVSPFEAKKVGAALVSRNIARHIETHFLSKPKSWKPLIYCWRGGQRSGAMTYIFRRVGWDAQQLEGGYKRYRQQVIERLATLPPMFAQGTATFLQGFGNADKLVQSPTLGTFEA